MAKKTSEVQSSGPDGLPRSDVVFFFGAGASAGAKLPDTKKLARGFLFVARGESFAGAVDWVTRTLGWAESDEKMDVEALLDVLERLGEHSKDNLQPLVRARLPSDVTAESFTAAASALRHYIRQMLTAETRLTLYMQPIRQYLQDAAVVDVISVNYDTCVEQFCDAYDIPCEDGFGAKWNDSRFDEMETGIRLYKLHGSTLWYASARGSYLKLPIHYLPQVTLFTGESVENLMLYPAQKLGLEEPILDMLSRVKRLLADPQTRFLVVVGYSFRDDHITRLIYDAASQNRDLIVILVDPSAGSTFLTRLRYMGDVRLRKPSPISDRVVCLPYRFEDLFPALRDHYLENLRKALADEKRQSRAAIAGQQTSWHNAVMLMAEAEASNRALSIIERSNSPLRGMPRLARARMSALLALNQELLNPKGRGRHSVRDFFVHLRSTVADGLWLEMMAPPSPVRLLVGHVTTERGRQADGDLMNVLTWLRELAEYIGTRLNWSGRTTSRLSDMLALLKELAAHLESFPSDADVKQYLELRAKALPEYDMYQGTVAAAYEQKAWLSMQEALSRFERQLVQPIFDKYAHLMGQPDIGK
jgi:hypothetical protein